MQKSFQSIPPVEPYSNYIDIAFRRAKLEAELLKKRQKGNKKSKQPNIFAFKRVEYRRIDTIREILIKRMDNILRSFPSIDTLPLFYNELLKATIDYASIKKSFGAVKWAIKKINEMHSIYSRKIGFTREEKHLHSLRKEFYGRISSVLKQIQRDFLFLEESRKVMKTYPIIKELPTIAIAGFPNAGKTTLLSRLSSSKPEIAEYAFTTKHVNIGYIKINGKELQLIDTPGTLARPDKMNNIELQAHLAIKHLANAIIFIFDPTEQYPLEKQEQLLKLIKKENKPILLYMSKTDIADAETINKIKQMHKEIITDPAQLQQQLSASLKDFAFCAPEAALLRVSD